MNSTFTSLLLYTVLVFILCSCQDAIAEDAREGLPSCPSDPTMVTWLHFWSTEDMQIRNQFVINCLLTNLISHFFCCMCKMHACMFDREFILLLWFNKSQD